MVFIVASLSRNISWLIVSSVKHNNAVIGCAGGLVDSGKHYFNALTYNVLEPTFFYIADVNHTMPNGDYFDLVLSTNSRHGKRYKNTFFKKTDRSRLLYKSH